MRVRPVAIRSEDQLVELLRGRRIDLGLSQDEATFQAGFPDAYVAKLEAPHRKYGKAAVRFIAHSLAPWLEVLGLRLVLMDTATADELIAASEADPISTGAHRPYPDRTRDRPVETRRVVRMSVSLAA